MKTTELADSNIFLLPNSTFWVELIIFLIVLLLFWKVILPPVQKVLSDRDEMVRRTAEESRLASEKLACAQERYHTVLAEARTESARVRDEARVEGTRLRTELREQTNQEISQIQQRGIEELTAQRTVAVRELRSHVGEFSVALAVRVVGENLAGGAEQAATVARYLEDADREGSAW